MPILPKAIYRFNTIPFKTSVTFFTEIEQTVLKFAWNHKRPQIATAISKKQRSRAGSITLQDFKLDYKALVIKTARHWQTRRSTEQNTGPRNEPHTRPVRERRAEICHAGKDSLFREQWEHGITLCKKRKGNWTTNWHHTQRPTQNRLKTWLSTRPQRSRRKHRCSVPQHSLAMSFRIRHQKQRR